VVIPFEDIYKVQSLLLFLPLCPKYFSEIKFTCGATIFLSLKIQKSEHAKINPAITIILRQGAGGRGVPPLKSRDDCK